jgi:hypothetical protein
MFSCPTFRNEALLFPNRKELAEYTVTEVVVHGCNNTVAAKIRVHSS